MPASSKTSLLPSQAVRHLKTPVEKVVSSRNALTKEVEVAIALVGTATANGITTTSRDVAEVTTLRRSWGKVKPMRRKNGIIQAFMRFKTNRCSKSRDGSRANLINSSQKAGSRTKVAEATLETEVGKKVKGTTGVGLLRTWLDQGLLRRRAWANNRLSRI